MGANAGTAVPVYASGEVLTAARLNLTNCGVPVFSGTATRDAAFGGSGEKVLAEGQLCYLEDANVVQYYDSASWLTVGPTTNPALVCVKAETAFSGASSVTADNVFTSSYTNYVLLLNYTTSTTNFVFAKLRTGGTSASTNYTSQQIQGFSTTASTNARTGATAIEFGYYGNTTREASVVQIMGPQLAQATQFDIQGGGLGGTLVQKIYGLHTTATAYDGIELLVTSGTMTGTYAIYGYSKVV